MVNNSIMGGRDPNGGSQQNQISGMTRNPRGPNTGVSGDLIPKFS